MYHVLITTFDQFFWWATWLFECWMLNERSYNTGDLLTNTGDASDAQWITFRLVSNLLYNIVFHFFTVWFVYKVVSRHTNNLMSGTDSWRIGYKSNTGDAGTKTLLSSEGRHVAALQYTIRPLEKQCSFPSTGTNFLDESRSWVPYFVSEDRRTWLYQA